MSTNLKLKNSLKHHCYLITNLLNNKVYVGVSYKDISIRFKEHLKVSRCSNKKYKKAINRAISKYGENNFAISLLSEYPCAKLAYEAEVAYIKQYKSNNKKYGYNESHGGDCGPLTIKHSRKTVISVINDYCDGIKLKDIAIKYSISYFAVFDITRLRIAKIHKIPKKTLSRLSDFKLNSNKRKRMSCEQLIKIVEDFLSGYTMDKIAEKYLFDNNAIWNALHRHTNSDFNIGEELELKLKEKLSLSKYWSRKSK